MAELASPEALTALLRARVDRRLGRLNIRDAQLDQWEPRGLSLGSHPPEVEVALTVSAVRYVVAGGRIVAGSAEHRHHMHLVWTLALAGGPTAAWRLVRSTEPADGIAGA